jgi:hypothetical protein
MQITIRMPDDHFNKIDQIAKKLGLKKSDISRIAIKQFIDSYGDNPEKTPFSKAQHLIGVAESGIPDLGQNHRRYLIEKIKRAGK